MNVELTARIIVAEAFQILDCQIVFLFLVIHVGQGYEASRKTLFVVRSLVGEPGQNYFSIRNIAGVEIVLP